MPKPASDPARPISTVSHAGIGSGPGPAKRASVPVLNPVSRIDSTCAMRRSVPRHDRALCMPEAPFVRSIRLSDRPAGDYTDELRALQGVERLELDPRVTFL